MQAIRDRPPRGSRIGAALVGASLCLGVLVIGRLHVLSPGWLTATLAMLLGIAVVLSLQQHRSLARATETQRLQRAVIDSSPNALVTSDHEGRIVALNPAAERVFGRSAKAIQGLWMTDLIVAPASGSSEPTATQTNILDRLGQSLKLDGRRADGSLFPTELSILRVNMRSKTMFAAYIRDLTDQMKVDAAHVAQQERIHQSEKLSAMGSLLAGVAHELNNPLAILVAQATLLREKAPTPDVERRAERIYAAAQRAGRIVKSFLAMARQKAPVRASLDLNSVIDAALELVGYGLRSAGVEVHFDRAPDLPPVDADRDLMVQVFANLFINAQQALAEKPGSRSIAVRSFAEAGNVVVDVADNGPGVPDELRERIFEPYFTTKPVGAGTGIGLSVCRSVVSAHAGTIEARPDAKEGATFRVVLPAAARIESDGGHPTGERRLTILVVDDETDVADSLAELLDIFGHQAIVLSSPHEALDRIRQQHFDAIFTDLRMPGMNGVSLRQTIEAVDPTLAAHTVIMTGDTVGGPNAERGGTRTNGGLFLEKPFTADNVRALLSKICAS